MTGLLQADIYISSVNSDTLSRIDQQLIESIRQQPGVKNISTAHRRVFWQNEKSIQLNIRGIDEQAFSYYRFKDESNSFRWQKFTETDSVIVSEPYAYHNDLELGDMFELPTDRGKQSFTFWLSP